MSSEQVYEAALRALERYGFGIVLAFAVLWFVRVDLVVPMVDAHRDFLRELSNSQRDIAEAMNEQTMILYALRAKFGERPDGGEGK